MKIGNKYYVYFKAGMLEQMKAKYGYAVADQLEGPYVLSDHPITDNVSYLEDAQAFSTGGQYFLLTTDNLGGNTGVFGDIILWRSKTGLRFNLSDAKIAMGNILDYWGTEQQHKQLARTPGHFERDPSGKLDAPCDTSDRWQASVFLQPGRSQHQWRKCRGDLRLQNRVGWNRSSQIRDSVSGSIGCFHGGS